MNKTALLTVIIAATCSTTDVSAQLTKSLKNPYESNHKNYPCPTKSHHFGRHSHAQVSYDAGSQTLTVSIPAHSSCGQIEIRFANSGSYIIKIQPGTTYSCNMGNYGRGHKTIIVSCGRIVVFHKQI